MISAPRYDRRRQLQLFRELLARARVWLPQWQSSDDAPDFGQALLQIVARLAGEVTERLDRIGDKNFRGFLHWLGVRGAPARAARVPLVLVAAVGSRPVLASRPVRVQAQGLDPPVVFETLTDVLVVSARPAALVAADAAGDAFFSPPPGLFNLTAPIAEPDEWLTRSLAAADSDTLQLDPTLGLRVGLILAIEGAEHRILSVSQGIVRIEPPLDTTLAAGTRVSRVARFDAFGAATRNRQEHSLFIGDNDALNLEGAASIEILNAAGLPAELQWSYWDLTGEEPQWRDFDLPAELDTASGAYVLKKTRAGAIGMRKLGSSNSRFLRARLPGVLADPIVFSNLRLSINCIRSAEGPPPALTGLANTSPLVLDTQFFPFGTEPRQFDSFFLSCPEAFSKADAQARITFTLADPTLAPLVATRVADECTLFAIGRDGQLQRLRFDLATRQLSFAKAVRPPLAENDVPVAGQRSFSIEQDLTARPAAVVTAEGSTRVAVAAEGGIWIWLQESPQNSWRSLGVPFPESSSTATREALQIVMLAEARQIEQQSSTDSHVFVLRAGELRRRVFSSEFPDPDTAPGWMRVPAPMGMKLERIVPIVSALQRFAGGTLGLGLIAVTERGGLLRLVGSRNGSAVTTFWESVELQIAVDPLLAPLAVQTFGGEIVIVAALVDAPPGEVEPPAGTGSTAYLAAVTFSGMRTGTPVFVAVEGKVQSGGFDVAFDTLFLPTTSTLVALLTVISDAGRASDSIVRWRPFGARADSIVTGAPVAAAGQLNGPPTVVSLSFRQSSIVVPGASSDVLQTSLDFSQSQLVRVQLLQLLSFAEPTAIQAGDVVAMQRGDKPFVLRSVAAVDTVTGLVEISPPFDPADVDLDQVRVASLMFEAARVTGKDARLLLDVRDDLTEAATLLVLDADGKRTVLKVIDIEELMPDAMQVVRRVAVFDASSTLPEVAAYGVLRDPVEAQLREAIRPQPLRAQLRSLLLGANLYFGESTPRVQTIDPIADTMTDRFVLGTNWSVLPQMLPNSALVEVLADAAQTSWSAFRPQVPQNPALSWEYWDGKAWLQIDGLVDGTENLLHGGDVVFCVPDDLQPTEVAGRPGHFIRARLSGGDYGQAEVVVTTTQITPDSNSQRIDRNPASVRAPSVLGIAVSYEVCCPVTPQFVFTSNNGSLLDQSVANRTAGATVAAFVPLSRLAHSVSASTAATGAGAVQTAAPPTSADRALYLGVDAQISGGPINLLFTVDERSLDAAFPLQVAVLRRGSFEAIPSEDGTRGLSQSGVLTLNIAESPTRSGLFGEELFWLRITPNPQLRAEDWQPAIRGVFLNAVQAVAAETQQLEVLGSSDGSPNQRVSLARPPLVADSLELRVREPLSEEQIATLLAVDPRAVERDLRNVPGIWVLWREVVDPQDHPPGARVYALDDELGVVQFGDGLHGAIPPAGRDAILAERYQHSGDARGNRVTAWSQLGLISPVAGVESVVVPEAAAGGADAADVEATLRGAPALLRHRNRGVTLRDLEQMAVQSSPQIVQARATTVAGGVRLITVGMAPEVRPKSAQLRALRAFLEERISPALLGSGRLQLLAPQLIRLQVDLRFTVTTLEATARLQQQARAALLQLFDPARGGLDGTGWPLGALPLVSDVAAVLVDLEDSAGLGEPLLRQRSSTDELAPLPARLDLRQLITLQEGDIDVKFVIDNAQVQA